jgi:hypothetical protein
MLTSLRPPPTCVHTITGILLVAASSALQADNGLDRFVYVRTQTTTSQPERETNTVSRPVAPERLIESLQAFADNVVGNARDRYGREHTPLFVCQLDLDTKGLPPRESKLYRTDTRGGAGPTMNNLQFDTALIRFLDAMTQVTGDTTYAAAVDDYLTYYLQHLPDPKTGLFPWGDHRGYDVVSDHTVGGPHEFKCTYPPWERMYAIHPEAVTRAIQGLRLHIYDETKSQGFSRHYPAGTSNPHSMNSSGFAWIAAWTFLARATGDEKYAGWSREMVEYFSTLRDPQTHLLAAHPYDPAYPATLKSHISKLRASRTEYMGQITFLSANLLRAADLADNATGERFRKESLIYLDAFADRMNVQANGSFYATFGLEDGEPLYPRITDGWSYIPQTNETHTWSNSVLGIRAPTMMAFAYLKTGDPKLLKTFHKLMPLWQLDEFSRPEVVRRPLPAGLIAQAILAFLNLHEATGSAQDLAHAGTFAAYAVKHHLTDDGWIVCGPSNLQRYNDPNLNVWRMYSNRGGSDDLALALLKYWLVVSGKPNTIVADPLCFW